MKAIFFGTGSIGRRHCFNLKKANPAVQLAFFRENGQEDNFSKEMGAQVISNFQDIGPDIAVSFICCPTVFRKPIYEKLISLNMPMYVEKPIASSFSMLTWLEKQLQEQNYTAFNLVGFNLRYLPVLNKVRNILKQGTLGNICRAYFEVGQYLPDWREGEDYRKNYSAQKKMGGGVVLDLCHEVDLAHYMFGDSFQAIIISKKLSSLEIDSEDTASLILFNENGPIVSINMDYVSRKKVRYFKIVGEQASLICDLMGRQLIIEGPLNDQAILLEQEDFCINASYTEALKAFLSLPIQPNKNHLTIEKSINTHKLLFSRLQS